MTMFDTVSPFNPDPDVARDVPAFVRDESQLRASFAGAARRTRIDRLYSHGSLKLRMPRSHGTCEAVLINTGGGIAGGDRLAMEFAIGDGAHVAITSQAAEKIYRAERIAATIATRMVLGDSARLDWLPQETIVFNGGQLFRSLDVDLDASATLTLLEIVVLGRRAHGETVVSGSLRDRWRIRRGGRLVLAEDVLLQGAIAEQMQRAAIGDGARAIATLVHVAPEAEDRLSSVRAVLDGASGRCGASAWNGCLVARFLATDAADIRLDAARAASVLTGSPMPRSWAC